MRDYLELRRLTPQGIEGKLCSASASVTANLAVDAEEPCSRQDRQLLRASMDTPDPLPLLCLRCRVSHPIEAWLRATHGRFQQRYGLDLLAMASYGLDDQGDLVLWARGSARSRALAASGTGRQHQAAPSQSVPFTYAELALRDGLGRLRGPTAVDSAGVPEVVLPFTAEVLRSYDPALCGLPHWARLRIQAHNGLKAYLREHGLLLISDWALLNDSSSRRVRQAWEDFGSGVLTGDQAVALHAAYMPLFQQAKASFRVRTGRASGWTPDTAFLQALAPEQEPQRTQEQLLAVACAIRTLRSGDWQRGLTQQGLAGDEDDPAGGDPLERLADPSSLESDQQDEHSASELLELIRQALQRAMDRLMPAELAAERLRFEKSPERQLAWELYGQGLSHRQIAPRCGKQQPWVSKLLDEKRRATAIATAAAIELRRHPAFSSCGRSVEAAERLVEALRNHLIQSEREGDIAPMRRWVQHALSQP